MDLQLEDKEYDAAIETLDLVAPGRFLLIAGLVWVSQKGGKGESGDALATDEAQEGIGAFFDKRTPGWVEEAAE